MLDSHREIESLRTLQISDESGKDSTSTNVQIRYFTAISDENAPHFLGVDGTGWWPHSKNWWECATLPRYWRHRPHSEKTIFDLFIFAPNLIHSMNSHQTSMAMAVTLRVVASTSAISSRFSIALKPNSLKQPFQTQHPSFLHCNRFFPFRNRRARHFFHAQASGGGVSAPIGAHGGETTAALRGARAADGGCWWRCRSTGVGCTIMVWVFDGSANMSLRGKGSVWRFCGQSPRNSNGVVTMLWLIKWQCTRVLFRLQNSKNSTEGTAAKTNPSHKLFQTHRLKYLYNMSHYHKIVDNNNKYDKKSQ